ncbi:MAG: nuclear transport factor 2 family protein [Halioglobus sp.]|nr:nuclear transport factor 2 family protein [Halioglobus sp.]
MEASDKIAVVHKYVEAFAKQDINIIKEIFAADGRVEDPVGTDIHDGIDAIVAFYENALGSGAKLELTGEARCAGTAVAFPFQVVMGDSRIDIIDVFYFNHEGKISDMKAYWGPENFKS